MMPDILIRGMEMPSGCSVCKLSFYDGEETVCPFCGAIMPSYSEREDSCPLVELPSHGDLIDAGSLYDDLVYDAELAERALDDTTLVGKERDYIQSEKDIKQNCAYYVSHAPVVIPAERREE